MEHASTNIYFVMEFRIVLQHQMRKKNSALTECVQIIGSSAETGNVFTKSSNATTTGIAPMVVMSQIVSKVNQYLVSSSTSFE